MMAGARAATVREKRNQGKGESGSAYIRKAALSQNSLEDLCLYFAGQN